MLGDAATLGDGTDTGKARVIMRDGEYLAVLAQPIKDNPLVYVTETYSRKS